MNAGNTVIVMGKYPQVGRVKTRLSPALTPEQAGRVHLACIQAVCRQTRNLARASRVARVTFAGTPDDRREAFGTLLGAWSDKFAFRPQGPGSLGDRLARQFATAFNEGAARVVAIGTDSPHLAVAAVPGAMEALETCDVVLGPAEDGGYYLIGLRRPCPDVFQGVDWGTDRVMRQTLDQAKRLGRRVKLLEVGYDLDRPEDLRRLMDELAAVSDNPALVELREKMQVILSDVPDWRGGHF